MPIRKHTDYIVFHVTATRPLTPAGVAEVTKMHKARGWSTIGYHYIIRLDGKVEAGRKENQIGAGVAGWNSRTLHIAFEGGLSQTTGKPMDTRTPAQSEAAIDLVRELLTRYPKAKLLGHRDLSPDRDGDGVIEPHEHLKACPCFDVIPWARQNSLPAADVKGNWEAVRTLTEPDLTPLKHQKLLKRAGYEFGPLDGIVGPKTRAATKRFQKAAGLPETGNFDKATVARLSKVANGPVVAALANDDTLKIIPPVAKATAGVLLEKGSRTIMNATLGQLTSVIGVVGGIAATVSEVTKVIEETTNATRQVTQQVQDVVTQTQNVVTKTQDVITQTQDVVSRTSLIFDTLIQSWPLLLVSIAMIVVLILFNRAKRIRVEEHNSGVNISRREQIEFLKLTDADLKTE